MLTSPLPEELVDGGLLLGGKGGAERLAQLGCKGALQWFGWQLVERASPSQAQSAARCLTLTPSST